MLPLLQTVLIFFQHSKISLNAFTNQCQFPPLVLAITNRLFLIDFLINLLFFGQVLHFFDVVNN